MIYPTRILPHILNYVPIISQSYPNASTTRVHQCVNQPSYAHCRSHRSGRSKLRWKTAPTYASAVRVRNIPAPWPLDAMPGRGVEHVKSRKSMQKWRFKHGGIPFICGV